jgi:catechol 2,3-dioxygenase-like lactoylglutathione lyase family enzyme
MRLNRVILFVKDIDRMAAFYGGALGLRPVEETRTDAWLEFDAGGIRLALHAIPVHIADRIEISSPPRPREETPIKPAFEVDDVTSERRRLESLSVTVRQHAWGGCDAIDPEGNVFGFYSLPGAALK